MIQVRKSNYRGQDGWTVSGRTEESVFPLRVFFEFESAARRFAALVRSGNKPDQIDWQP